MALLTTKELQKNLNIKRDTAYALMRSKFFPSMKIGGRYFVATEELNNWIRQSKNRNFRF